MSTRSGKKIHSSFHENLTTESESLIKSERKTRSKAKENLVETVLKANKKRANYVSYPTDDEHITDGSANSENEGKTMRALRNNTLKEHDTNVLSQESVEVNKVVRITRRNKKPADNAIEKSKDTVKPEKVEPAMFPNREKKLKKKVNKELENTEMPKKKSKKRRGKKSHSIVVDETSQEGTTHKKMNKSNASVDSFHSAAGSPLGTTVQVSEVENETTILADQTLTEDTPRRMTRKRKSSCKEPITEINVSSEKTPEKLIISLTNSKQRKSMHTHTPVKLDTTIEQDKKKRKSLANTTFDKITEAIVNTTYEKPDDERALEPNTTSEKSDDNRSSAIKDALFNPEVHSSSIDLSNDVPKRKSMLINTTFDKSNDNVVPGALLTTPSKRKSVASVAKDSTLNKNGEQNSSFIAGNVTPSKRNPSIVNTTFDKDTKPIGSATKYVRKSNIKDTTFEKENQNSTYELDKVLSDDTTYVSEKIPAKDTTFNKNKTRKKSLEHNSTYDANNSRKSGTNYSQNNTFDKNTNNFRGTAFDNNLDSTFDKPSSKSSLISSDNNSSITLDKSSASRISITSDESSENIINTTPVLIESSMDESQTEASKDSPKPGPVPMPLNREGTFTKDGPEVASPQAKEKTPTKRMSLPSPGCTPFPLNKSSQKSVLNVTRSIEKGRRSSLTDRVPRSTRVMFCSPVDNPAAVLQQQRKVIKSSMKGSNKSFVLEVSRTEARPATRKRSYTQGDADDGHAKRKRLADDLQQSVDRLSRPRTSSAAAKLGEPSTPSKKSTPSKVKDSGKLSRTKLPNFAALHQRHFAKMESLDECQERKAKRARQLLTPTGSVNIIERTSPKDPEPQTQKDASDKDTKTTDKTPVKPQLTIESLKPGYTRFGFRLNIENNPFSVASKTVAKPKETKPNGLTRQATLPSLAGATSARREVAKQTVMREKSFTDRRNAKRTENRTIIKGVRTNRRFELQMKMRNID